ncbi:MAG: proteasome assembly chaperone family protein [Candidatus Altiarchaeales archaeon]|nr:proteasome assembly chaperone family protein [Candidatus Altiarchaeales archaeon]
MDDVVLKFLDKPKLSNPIMVEGLPGIGLVGKLAGDHLLDELKAKKFAELYSPFLPPQVGIQEDGTVKLVNMEFHSWSRNGRELILLTGDFQGITPDSQYQLAERTLDLALDLNVKRMYTLGGLATGNITQSPRVFGAATSRSLVKEHAKYDIVFREDGAIFGASGLLLGLGVQRDVEGVCLMGETHGQIVDAKSAEAVLRVLTRILGVEVDMTALENKAKDTERQMGQISKMISDHQRAEQKRGDYSWESQSYIR